MRAHNIPLFGAVVLSTGFVLTYTISVCLGHVYYWFPYISDTGAEAPESGIFGFTLNTTAALFVMAMYIRYRQVSCVNEKMSLNISPLWNKISIFLGCCSCFGMNMVANFSELDMGIPHLSGAFICFTAASIYFLIQTKISYHFINHPSDFSIRKSLFVFRFVLCLLMMTFYFLTLWFGNLAIKEFTGAKLNYWKPEDGGFEYRLVSTFSEWLTAIAIMVYIMTFTLEFRRIECDGITVRIKTKANHCDGIDSSDDR